MLSSGRASSIRAPTGPTHAIPSAADPYTVERTRVRVTRWSGLPDDLVALTLACSARLGRWLTGRHPTSADHRPEPFGNSISESSMPSVAGHRV